MGNWRLGFVGLTLAAAIGCGKKSTSIAERPSPTVSIPNSEAQKNDVAVDTARQHLKFSEAVCQFSPGNQLLPPATTVHGLSTAVIRTQVEKIWDSIRFRDAQGKPITYMASINTDFGSFRVQLNPDIAPNHVRNFVALARVGYYNRLTFDALVHQEGDAGPDSKLEMVEAGCPLGTGEPGIGHLGYWLHPEIDDTIVHQPGSLGAFHDEDPNSAACRFYVTLTKAPAMDGNFTVFGQVVEGLDVVRTISKLPKVNGSFQPERPVMIRSVIIETQDAR